MPFINRDGVNIFYSVTPSDNASKLPVVLFSHGFASGSLVWKKQIEALSKNGHFRCVVWDMRGHGQSDSPEDPAKYSKMHQVEDIYAILDAVGVTPDAPAVLAGHSMGGMDNLLFYFKYPKYVKGYVVYASGPGFAKEAGWEGWQKQMEKQAAGYKEKGLDALIGLDKEMGHRSALGLELACRRVLGQHKDDPLYASLPEGVLHLANHLDDFKLPVKVVVGEKDKGFFRSSEMLSKKMPQAEFVKIEDAGHMMCVKNADKFNEVLVRFLNGLCGVSHSKL